jgi:hypothetical protein
MDVAPGRRRHLLDEGQHFCIAARLLLRDQPRKDTGVVIDDGVRDQPRTLVTDLDFDVGPAGEFFLAADLSDGGAELVVGLDPVLAIFAQPLEIEKVQQVFLEGRKKCRSFQFRIRGIRLIPSR